MARLWGRCSVPRSYLVVAWQRRDRHPAQQCNPPADAILRHRYETRRREGAEPEGAGDLPSRASIIREERKKGRIRISRPFSLTKCVNFSQNGASCRVVVAVRFHVDCQLTVGVTRIVVSSSSSFIKKLVPPPLPYGRGGSANSK